MTLLKILLRFLYILYIILKFNLPSLVLNKNSIKGKIFLLLNKKTKINEKQLRLALEKLGPLFIKLGQILSTRADLLPNNIIQELKKLQTNTYPTNFHSIKKIIETTLNKKITLIFKKINENPIASASIAQIHSGILLDNKKVIIKILKPNIQTSINQDIKILKIIEFTTSFLFKKLNRLKLKEIIKELENTLKAEMNLQQEAANLTKFKNNFNKNIHIYVPNIHWHLVTKTILVTEYIDGINIINKQKLMKEKICLNILSTQLVDLFFIQILKHNFFHADLHPGNILISKNNLNTPVIIFIDFGITSDIKNEEKLYLAENILAFAQKNYRKIVSLHLKAQTITTTESITNIENDLCYIFEPILNKKIKEISFYKIIPQLLALTRKLNMQLQPQLILFQKSLLTIESICRQLNPNINLWKITRQSIEKNFLKEIIINKTKKHIINTLKTIFVNTSNNDIFKKTDHSGINYKKSFLNYILSNSVLTFVFGYLIGLSIFLAFLKYYQTILFLM